MTKDITIQKEPSNCRMCGRMLVPDQKYCREHKCNQSRQFNGITISCQKEKDHTGRCRFMYLGEVIETGLRKNA